MIVQPLRLLCQRARLPLCARVMQDTQVEMVKSAMRAKQDNTRTLLGASCASHVPLAPILPLRAFQLSNAPVLLDSRVQMDSHALNVPEARTKEQMAATCAFRVQQAKCQHVAALLQLIA